MSWALLVTLVCALGLSTFAISQRRRELARMRGVVRARERAVRTGAHRAKLESPVVDLSRCMGCGTCVVACPEDGVLELVHGQAVVVRGARCKGISACERECPVGAITITIQAAAERKDIPCLDEKLEAIGAPNLFLAGEVTARARVKTAIDQGTAVAAEVADRRKGTARASDETFDLVIVGAGPAGLACALEAKRRGLTAVLLDQEARPGGTVARYPRAKLVLTQPTELPLVGRLDAPEYRKEELIEMWDRAVVDHGLDFRPAQCLAGIDPREGGGYAVRTTHEGQEQVWKARAVCLALGRRGTPRKLGVEGEHLQKVSYSLLDAAEHRGRRILVVGGGDSAVEAALGLSRQEGTEVTLSYRRESFTRLAARNEERLEAALSAGEISLLTSSEVTRIGEGEVELVQVRDGAGLDRIRIPNDEVFVMAGGIAPIQLLQDCGVSFDPALRPSAEAPGEQGTGLLPALRGAFVVTLLALGWAVWNFDYYALARAERPASPDHALLRPGHGFGLWMGILSVALIVFNLAYLLRRSPRFRLRLGSLRAWMTSHVVTGFLAVSCAALHAAMAPRDTPGGHAFWALAFLLVTGAIGRYLYAAVPRAANGHELELSEVKARLARIEAEWDDGQVRFREEARRRVEALVEARQWKRGLLARIASLVAGQRDLRRMLSGLRARGRREGVAEEELRAIESLARRAYTAALSAARFEDLRALANTWRYLHRWAAVLMVVLLALHIATALAFRAHWGGVGG
ncbi:MAG TPA: FAD-binding protein [Planctomycetes bacterium]|nr:FAD-binding protein [Planctomycetota bacterium]